MSDRGGSEEEPHPNPIDQGSSDDTILPSPGLPEDRSGDIPSPMRADSQDIAVPSDARSPTASASSQSRNTNDNKDDDSGGSTNPNQSDIPSSTVSVSQRITESTHMTDTRKPPLSPPLTALARAPLISVHSLPNETHHHTDHAHAGTDAPTFNLPDKYADGSDNTPSSCLPLSLALSSPVMPGPLPQQARSVAQSENITPSSHAMKDSLHSSQYDTAQISQVSQSQRGTNQSESRSRSNSINSSSSNGMPPTNQNHSTVETNPGKPITRTQHAGSCDSGMPTPISAPAFPAAPEISVPTPSLSRIEASHIRTSSTTIGGHLDLSLIQQAIPGVSGRSSSSRLSTSTSGSCISSSMGHRSSIASTSRFTSRDLFGGPKPSDGDEYFFSLPATLLSQGLVISLEGIAVRVLSYLTIKELLRLRRVSSRFRDLVALTFENMRVVNLDQFWAKLGLRHTSSVIRLAQSFRSCTSLSLSYCNQVKEAFLLELLDAIFPTPERKLELRQLKLYYCFLLTDSTIQAVCMRHPRLRLLDIGSCRLLTDRGSLAPLSSMPELMYLGASGTALPGPALFQALQREPGIAAANAASIALNRVVFASQQQRRVEQKTIDFEASDLFQSDSNAPLHRTGSGLPSTIENSSTPAASSAAVHASSQSAVRGASSNIAQPRGHSHSQSVDHRSFRALAGASSMQSHVSPQSVSSKSEKNMAKGFNADTSNAIGLNDPDLASEVGVTVRDNRATSDDVPEDSVPRNEDAAQPSAYEAGHSKELTRDDAVSNADLRHNIATPQGQAGSSVPTPSNVDEATSLPSTLDVKPAIVNAPSLELSAIRPPGTVQLETSTPAQWNSHAGHANEISPRGASVARTSLPGSHYGSAESATSTGAAGSGADGPGYSAAPEYPIQWPIHCSFPSLSVLEIRECTPDAAKEADFDSIRQRHPRLVIHCSQFWFSRVNSFLISLYTSAATRAAEAASLVAQITGVHPFPSPTSKSVISEAMSATSPTSLGRRVGETLERIEEVDILQDADGPASDFEGEFNEKQDPEVALAIAATAASASSKAAAIQAAFTALATVTPPLTPCLPPLSMRTSVLVNPQEMSSGTSSVSSGSGALSLAGSRLPPLALHASPSLSNPSASMLAELTSGSDGDASRAALNTEAISETAYGKGMNPASAPARSHQQQVSSVVSPRAAEGSVSSSPSTKERVGANAVSRPKPSVDGKNVDETSFNNHSIADGSASSSPVAGSQVSSNSVVSSQPSSALTLDASSQADSSTLSQKQSLSPVRRLSSPGGSSVARELTRVREEEGSNSGNQEDSPVSSPMDDKSEYQNTDSNSASTNVSEAPAHPSKTE